MAQNTPYPDQKVFLRLISAVNKSDTEAIRRLVTQEGVDVNYSEWFTWLGTTPLIRAAQVSSVKSVHELISLGSDVHATDSRKLTAMHHAVTDKKGEIIDMLASAGADINVRDKYGETPLMKASASGIGIKPLTRLVELGADMEAADNKGNTALHHAAGNGRTNKPLDYLLRSGASVNVRNTKGETPLVWAVCSGRTRGAEMLLELGAEIDSRDSDGRTPLLRAIQRGGNMPDRIELLVENGADIYAESEKGLGIFNMLFSYCSIDEIMALAPALFHAVCSKGPLPGGTVEKAIRAIRGNSGLVTKSAMHMAMVVLAYFIGTETAKQCFPKSFNIFLNRNFEDMIHRVILAYRVHNIFRDRPEDVLEVLMMGEGKASGMPNTKRDELARYVGFLLDALNKNPSSVLRFVEKRVGKHLESWTAQGIKGADALVSRLVGFVNQTKKEDGTPFDRGVTDWF